MALRTESAASPPRTSVGTIMRPLESMLLVIGAMWSSMNGSAFGGVSMTFLLAQYIAPLPIQFCVPLASV